MGVDPPTLSVTCLSKSMVIQEVALGQEVYIACGDTRIEFLQVLKGLIYLESNR